MVTVNSLSGGKTSSYMAYHYPADIDLFALVCVNDPIAKYKDPKLAQRVNDKFEKSGCIKHGEFIGTAEDDIIIKTMFELEQKTGREIVWVRDKSFEQINREEEQNKVPSMVWRYCTSKLKMRPIAEWLYLNVLTDIAPLVSCNIGIRMDEIERAKMGKDERLKTTKIQIGHRLNKDGEKRSKMWKDLTWGISNYPLIYDKVFYWDIKSWAESSGIPFAKDSNCIGCFWKHTQQLRKNWEDHPNKMEWFSKQEEQSPYFYKPNIDYKQIKKLGIQQEFNFGTGSGCQAGFCTD